MKRNGWLEPWRAGWKNLRAMFLHGADFFLLKPGLIVLFLGLALMLPTIAGPISIGPLTLSLYWSLLGLTFGVVGMSSALLGAIVQVLYSYAKNTSDRWLIFFEYDRMLLTSGCSLVLGLALVLPLIQKYFNFSFRLPNQADWMEHCAVLGLFFVATAFLLFSNTLVLHAVAMRVKKRAYQA